MNEMELFEQNEKRVRKAGRRFIIAALVLQLLVCFLWTEDALVRLFPAYVQLVGEQVTLQDNSYTEFYPLRRRTAEAELIVLGVDFSYRETYPLLLDLLSAIKNDVSIQKIIIDCKSDNLNVSSLITAEDEETRTALADRMKKENAGSDAFRDFLVSLSQLRGSLPPHRKFSAETADLSSEKAKIASRLLQYAEEEADGRGSPVLVITDTIYLDETTGVERALEQSGFSCVSVQFQYAEKQPLIGERKNRILLVDAEKLKLFDELYSNASAEVSGRFSDELFSDLYSTEISFLLYNCTLSSSDGAGE